MNVVYRKVVLITQRVIKVIALSVRCLQKGMTNRREYQLSAQIVEQVLARFLFTCLASATFSEALHEVPRSMLI